MRSSLAICTIVLATAALSACQSMLPGKVYAVPAGRILQFEIEKSYGHGRMTALDTSTGEKFSGEYSGSYTGQDSVYGHVGDANVMLIKPPTGANAFGILVGDKGTTIRLYFAIKPGLTPTGHGTGTDQNGQGYEAYF